jgi:anti-anti-sigma factor
MPSLQLFIAVLSKSWIDLIAVNCIGIKGDINGSKLMGINMTVSASGDEVTIAVIDKFDFQLYDEFRAAYAETAGIGVTYRVDLADIEYLDSSALGMLLLLREHAGGPVSNIEITQASPEVRKILNVANFSKLFRF